MAIDRRTLYVNQNLGDRFDAALDMRPDEREGQSLRTISMAIRYAALWRACVPQLSREQWMAVCDANNGLDEILLMDPMDVGLALWPNVADSEGLGDKWGIGQDDLVRTMHSWTLPQQIAAYEAVRAFWVHSDTDRDEAMRLAGMIGD